MPVRFATEEAKLESVVTRRLWALQIGMAIGFLVLLGRGVAFHVQNNDRLDRMAMKQYRAAVRMATERSRIVDAKGRELAVSIPVWSLYADPKEVKQPGLVARKLASLLSVAESGLLERLRSPRRFVWIKRKITHDELGAVRDSGLQGVHWMQENRRFYPNGSLASQVLGAVGVESQPLEGIELAYDKYLFVDPEVVGDYQRDARGHLYLSPSGFNEGRDQETKGDVWLTLDKNIQFATEEILSRTVEESRAKGGMAIVLNPKTGDVLAMASVPNFDPNHAGDFSPEHWRNRAVTDLFEPGSAFKPITFAAALESGVLNLEESIFCEDGNYTIDGRVIRDSHPYHLLTVPEIMKVSSNIGTLKIGQKVKDAQLYQTQLQFGFGAKTGIDFPGESAGLVRPASGWRPVEKATISFGQGISVTALQLAGAYGAIANGGLQMKPHLVERVVARDGTILYSAKHEVLRQSVSPQTAQILKQLLAGVVQTGGTGTRAATPDYSVAGKTGTAQKVNPETRAYYEDRFMASFAGFAPVEDPRLVVLVVIDDPRGGMHTGGGVAAPAFREILVSSLRYLGTRPEVETTTKSWEASLSDTPAVIFTTEADRFRLPDFTGVSMRGVLQAAGPAPVEFRFKGRGIAVHQSPEAGALVGRGDKIFVEFQ